MDQPHDPHAEQAIIGTLLWDPTLLPTINAIIAPADMYNPNHTTIYQTITNLAPLGPIDPITTAHALHQTGQLTRIGGPNYLHTCLAAANPTNALQHAHIIATHATTRALKLLAARINQTADTPDPHLRQTQLETLQTQLTNTINGTRHQLNGRHHHLQPANQFRILAVKWLWNTRIPIGEITLISGREGVGKSIFLAWMAAAITNGNLPGQWHGTPRAVLYAAAEDSWNYTIAPRMLAAGANLDLVYRIDMENPDGTHTGINLPTDMHHLGAAAAQADAAILMLDPLLSVFDDDINVFKSPEVRAVLQPLRAAAETSGIAIVGLAHYNKTKHPDSNSMIANSRAFVEVARAAIAIAVDPDADEYTCVVTQGKNNLGTLTLPSLNYTIDDVTLETEDGDDAHVGRLRWTGESEVTADELLTGTAGDRTLSEASQAILDWVTQRPPPVTVGEVVKEFEGEIKYETVKKTLARLARSGRLLSPGRGLYQSPTKPVRNRQQRTNSNPKPGHPPIPFVPVPTVPNVPHTYITTAQRERERETEGVIEVSPGTEEQNGINGQRGQEGRGTLGTGTMPSPARAIPDQQASVDPAPNPAPDPDDEPEEWWKK